MKNVSILEKPNNYYHHGYEPIRKKLDPHKTSWIKNKFCFPSNLNICLDSVFGTARRFFGKEN